MSDKPWEPEVDERGVPWCPHDKCKQYDGKRCRLTGFRPAQICEPAVVELAELAATAGRGQR